MPKAYILNDQLDASDRASIEAALRAAGYESVYDMPSDISVLDPSEDIGILGLPVVSGDEATTNARMQIFAGLGIRIVCIWLHGEEGVRTGVPEGVGKYGITVDIGSPELGNAIKSETDVWEEPGGIPRPAPATKRNKC